MSLSNLILMYVVSFVSSLSCPEMVSRSIRCTFWCSRSFRAHLLHFDQIIHPMITTPFTSLTTCHHVDMSCNCPLSDTKIPVLAVTFDELITGYSGRLDISAEWKNFWMTVNCMVCSRFIYVGTILIEKSEIVPSYHIFTQWLLWNTQVPPHGIDVWASINAYERDNSGNVSPGGPDLYSTVGGHQMVTKAFVIGSYFWYVFSFESFQMLAVF